MSLLSIVHLSDCHFGTILPGVCDGLVETVHELKPDLILITGDITQRARASQFRAAKHFTYRMLPTPMIAVPGNHDIPLLNPFGRFISPYHGFKKLFKDQLEKDFIYGDVLVTGLNSTSRWRHVQGAFDHERLHRRLEASALEPKVHIAAFHHPMDCAKPQDEKNLLKENHKVAEILAHHEVDLIVGGHIHDPFVTLSQRRYPEIKRQMVITVAGTCTSWRTRRDSPNSFQKIEVDTKSVPTLTITRYDQRENLRFTAEKQSRFYREGAAGWTGGLLAP